MKIDRDPARKNRSEAVRFFEEDIYVPHVAVDELLHDDLARAREPIGPSSSELIGDDEARAFQRAQQRRRVLRRRTDGHVEIVREMR